jgi:hypothetical protein
MLEDVSGGDQLALDPKGTMANRNGPTVVDGRFCKQITPQLKCCLPCPLTDWVYPDNFDMMAEVANWVCVVGTICCLFLLLSYAVLPVDKTHRHYLSICTTSAVVLMNVSLSHTPSAICEIRD